MKISELIEKLNNVKEEHGDIRVEVRNDAAEFDDAEVVETTFYIKKSGREVVVFIDV